MKTLLAIALLASVSAHAIPIEDNAERLVFDLTWTAPSMFGIDLQGEGRGAGGSDVLVLSGTSANPHRYYIEIHRRVDGVALPWWGFQLTFQGWNEFGASHPPDPVFGTITAPRIGYTADHLFAVAGNDHAVRVVVGALPVPEGGETLALLCTVLMLLAAYSTLGWRKP